MRWLALAALTVPLSAYATERPDRSPPIDPVLRALNVPFEPNAPLDAHQRLVAQAAGSQLVSLCPDCQLSTIEEEGPCGWARSHRKIIKSAVLSGMTEDQIVDTYVDVYGPNILAIDENSPARIASWAGPYALALIAFFVVLGVGRRMKRPSVASTLVAPTDADRRVLQRELSELD